MRTIVTSITIFVLVVFAQLAQAQTDEPRFPGCDDPADVDCADMKMMQFIFSNLSHPEGNPGGEVVAVFTVKADGTLADIEIVESLNKACDQEVIRIVNLMPNWLPAEEGGAPVDMDWEVVVKFVAK